jgi:hypothetical protein
MTTYHVYGNYGYQSECELYASDNCNEAKRWAENYVRQGDFGGYAVIEVANFSASGEYQVYWCRSEEGEPDWNRNWNSTAAELA